MADNRNKKDDKLEKCELGDNELGEVSGGSGLKKFIKGKLEAGKAKLMYGVPPEKLKQMPLCKYGIAPEEIQPKDAGLNPLPTKDESSNK